MVVPTDGIQLHSQSYWWQDIAVALEPILDSMKYSSSDLTQDEIEVKLDDIHHAYVMAHRVGMPISVKAQLIAAICHLQMSFCARYEGQTRTSVKHHHIALVEWVAFRELVQQEGIKTYILQ